MPRQRLEEHKKTDTAPYDLWEQKGLLTVTDTFGGIKNDYSFIIKHLRDIITTNNLELKAIAYDPHNADGFLHELDSFGVDLVSITQSARSLNDATVDFELEARAENIIYDAKNELMTWSVINAKKVSNSFGEVKIDKEVNSPHKRIDVADAIIDAYTLAMKKASGKVDVSKYATDEFLSKLWS
jgi:phage terminase large subunit-like protein